MPLSRENTATNTAAAKKKQAEEELELEESPRSSLRSIDQDHQYTMGAAESSEEVAGPTPKKFEGEQSRQDEENVHVSLTYDPLDATKQMARVKSAKAGAVVLFAGCTRDSFASKSVTHLAYSTYAPLALKTLSLIATKTKKEHNLTAIAITHRLGQVDIGDESILIAVSSPHRKAAWRAGEACLEDVKKQVEIWKEEWFEDGGVWRSNRDGQEGVPVFQKSSASGKGKEAERRRASHSSRDIDKGGKERRKVSVSAPSDTDAKDVLPKAPSRRKSSGPSTIGIKKAATVPARPKPTARTTTFYEGGFEV